MPERAPGNYSSDAVVRSYEARLGRHAAQWVYTDSAGRHVGTVLRWNGPDGKKTIRPVSLIDGVWTNKAMPSPRPLYRLPELEAAETVYVTEGEKAADAMRLVGFVATTSSHGSQSAEKTDWSPLAGKRVVILPDNDESGREYAADVVGLLRQLDPPPTIRILEIPDLPPAGDVADLPAGTEEECEALRARLLAMTETAHDACLLELDPAPRSETDPGTTTPERPSVWIAAGEKARITDQSLAILTGEFFQSGGQLVRCIPTPHRSCIVTATREAVDDVLNRRIDFRRLKVDRNGRSTEIVCDSPEWLAKNIVGLQKWPGIRPLEAIHRGPFIRQDGTLGGLTSGYDVQSRCLVETNEDWQELASPVTQEQVAESVARLRSLVDQFPFSNEAAFSVWLAAILSRLARPAIDGPCPLFIINASTPGSGKTLLAKVASLIADGEKPGMITLSTQSDEENRKLFTSSLQAGDGVLVFDNLVGKLQSPALDRLLTSTEWSDRRLGQTQMLKLANLAIYIMTTNNGSVAEDTCRRSLVVTLSPVEEKPAESEFRIPRLEKYVAIHRRELVIAAMRILLWHLQRGKPQYTEFRCTDPLGNDVVCPVRPFGSFEEWSEVVRHAIIGAGLPDPVVTMTEIAEKDEGNSIRRQFLEAWRDWNPEWTGTSKQLLEALSEPDKDEKTGVMAESLEAFVKYERKVERKNEPLSAAEIGYALRKVKHRTYSNLRIEPCGDCRYGIVWGLRCVIKPSAGGDASTHVTMPPAPSPHAFATENTGLSLPS
jgi:putative DNA primase/helicase